MFAPAGNAITQIRHLRDRQALGMCVHDSTLAAGNTDREQAALSCDPEIESLEGERVRALADLHVAEVTRLEDDLLLLKTSRVESHLSRELSRHLLLLRTLQADRKARTDPA